MSTAPSSFSAPAVARFPGNQRQRNADTMEDDVLVRRFATGDETAFVEIVQRYRGRIFVLTLGVIHNHADAEELTQDTFIRAHRALANFRGDSSLSTWLHCIALNLSRNRHWYFFRRHRHNSVSLDGAPGQEGGATFPERLPDAAPDPSQIVAAGEFEQLVERGMLRLDAHHREILRMRNHLHQSYEEIATALRINVGTVKSRIARARQNLREEIAEICPEFAGDNAPGGWIPPSRTGYDRTRCWARA